MRTSVWDSCLHYYAYRKMIAAKIVFDNSHGKFQAGAYIQLGFQVKGSEVRASRGSQSPSSPQKLKPFCV